ncbi:subtilase family protein [Thermosporothrix hazakensis]|uniref:Subtilase family protein n=2 Tax=Thermosporothrix TaxID=768650 RepID=A0A326USA6_THEHA|nr:S8 family serine peptidase [Thermosporothrix hazakensis]PZW36759.1 subtilase family protein [Thermosporothrix hazakensis]BBH89226.1 hypothetical protein KTC_39770 [Thermosporothrix sp. COM3]GCE47409.1 hypothetical protein KTH_22780 [Thermosporothrix hazakensis]
MSEEHYHLSTPWWSAPVMYWFEHELVVTFQSDVPHTHGTAVVADSLNIDELNSFLINRGFKLAPLGSSHSHTHTHDHTQINEQHTELKHAMKKCLFCSPASTGTTVVGFFAVEEVEMHHQLQDVEGPGYDTSPSRRVVNMLNQNLQALREHARIPIVSAAPNWLGGATPQGCISHGSPVYPPFPVPVEDSCPEHPGSWSLSLPELKNTPLETKTGKGVTVFVLDTMPATAGDPQAAIREAAQRAGDSNMLLQTIAAQMNREESPSIKFYYQQLSEELGEGADDQLVTGRDIYGKLYGFPMPDHGLFVTGILRDLAPDADIEYVRVLNDFGVSDSLTVINALEAIHARMQPINPRTGQPGDLHNKPVVINLSLVLTPSDEDLFKYWHAAGACTPQEHVQMMYDINLLRAPLHHAIQRLVESGAVIVGAAGNDSNTDSTPTRIGPRYPAAFPEVIAVGAVDRRERAARYSNYPQIPPKGNGIATYGGGSPTLNEIEYGIADAMIGVYTGSRYPALEAKNPPEPAYEGNNHCWAFWSGTSFATPIVSAVAARILEHIQPLQLPARHVAAEVQWILTDPHGQHEVFGTTLSTQPELGVTLLRATQCRPERPRFGR